MSVLGVQIFHPFNYTVQNKTRKYFSTDIKIHPYTDIFIDGFKGLLNFYLYLLVFVFICILYLLVFTFTYHIQVLLVISCWLAYWSSVLIVKNCELKGSEFEEIHLKAQANYVRLGHHF